MTTNTKTALSVPAGSSESTEQLVGSIEDLRNAGSALKASIDQVPDNLRAYVAALVDATHTIESQLVMLTSGIDVFCTSIGKLTSDAAAHPSTVLVQASINQLNYKAHIVATACGSTGTNLATYSDSANKTISAFNTRSNQLTARNAALQEQERELEAKLHEMGDAPWYDKIADAFKAAFGNLKHKIESEAAALHQDEIEVQANRASLAGIQHLVQRTSDLVAISDSLEVSWRNLGDNITDLGHDIAAITPEAWASGLAYVNSDWQAVKQILSKLV